MLGDEKIPVRLVIHERIDGTFSYDYDIDKDEAVKVMGGSSGTLDSVDSTENSLSVLQHNEPSSWHNPDAFNLSNTLDSVNGSNMVFNLFIEGEEPEYIDDEGSDDDSSTNVTPQAAQENKDEAKNHIKKEGFLERIEALRQGTEEEYQANIDQLADDIERAGMMDEFDDILKQLDDEKDTTVQKVQAAMRAGLL